MREIIISSNEKEQRLDRFLKKYLANASSGNIQKMLRKRCFKLNGKREKNGALFLQEGDSVEIYLSEESLLPLLKAEKQLNYNFQKKLNIVFENEDILVVNKPSGQLTVPDTSNDTESLSTQVQQSFSSLCSITFTPSPIQRLDKNTSGLVAFAKNYEALKLLNEKMRNRKIQKFYQCIVEGVPSQKTGSIKGFLSKNSKTNTVSLTNHKSFEDSKTIHTDYKILKSKNGFSLLEIELHSGRSHQIRVSLSHIGHPIIGDVKYGAQKLKNRSSRNSNSHQILHAYKIIVDELCIEQESKVIQKIWTSI